MNRRMFLTLSGAAVLGMSLPAGAAPLRAQALGEVGGHGLRLVGVALEFDAQAPELSADLTPETITVDGYALQSVSRAASLDPLHLDPQGRFLVIRFASPAPLYQRLGRDVTVQPVDLTVRYGDAQARAQQLLAPDIARFRQERFTDPETGLTLDYNIYIPDDLGADERLPLVNFMHDASLTGKPVTWTLAQGLGGVIWARPEEQARRRAIVIAPAFARKVVNDASEALGEVDTVKRLIESLIARLPIDPARLYTTGQSGGGMLSMAMMIKYPDFFAAALLVACQWDAAKVAPMAKTPLFIIVAREDLKAYPGQNAVTEALAALGAPLARAQWNGRWSAPEFAAAHGALIAQGAQVNHVILQAGTVVPEGESLEGAGAHMNTWPIAYDIEGPRDWLFAQRKA